SSCTYQLELGLVYRRANNRHTWINHGAHETTPKSSLLGNLDCGEQVGWPATDLPLSSSRGTKGRTEDLRCADRSRVSDRCRRASEFCAVFVGPHPNAGYREIGSLAR